MVKRVSKYASVNPRHPEAFGICDRSGFLFNRKDLVKQMQWAGDSLVWTGLWVGKPFLDVPNEQSRSPILGPDPVPIPFPRPPLMEETFWNEIADVPWEFQSFWWEEQEDSPSPQLYETVTGWGAPTQAEQALPVKEREAMLRKINFTKPGESIMTNLTGQTPYVTYRDLLTITNGGQGLPQDTLVPVQDGAGNNSPMLMSQNAVQFTKVMAVPCWITAERPENPITGTVGFNTEKDVLEVWNGKKWRGDE